MLRDLVDEGPAIPQRPWVGQGGASAPGGATHGPLPREAWVRRTGSTSWFGNRKLFLGRLASAVHVQDERAFINKAFKLGAVSCEGPGPLGLHLAAPARHVARAA